VQGMEVEVEVDGGVVVVVGGRATVVKGEVMGVWLVKGGKREEEKGFERLD